MLYLFEHLTISALFHSDTQHAHATFPLAMRVLASGSSSADAAAPLQAPHPSIMFRFKAADVSQGRANGKYWITFTCHFGRAALPEDINDVRDALMRKKSAAK
jgi:hypothetical protein